MRSIRKSLAAFFLILGLLVTSILGVKQVKAATANWTLQYLSYAPSSENIFNWSRVLTTTGTSLAVAYKEKTGPASIDIRVDGTLIGTTSTAGTTFTRNVTKNKLYSVKITLGGYSLNGTNRASGTVKY